MQAQAQAGEQRATALRASLEQLEKDQARDVADLTRKVEEATATTALGAVEQRVIELAAQLRAEQETREHQTTPGQPAETQDQPPQRGRKTKQQQQHSQTSCEGK
jgi:Tfp pilus assembly protein PilV